MAKLLKLRRGTTSQHSSFTGAEGEVTVDTTKDTLVVHDGSTAGGIPLAKEAGNVATSTEATNVTVSANNTTDETVYPTFVDGASGTQGVETDTGLTYNPSTGVLTTTSVTGNLTGDVTGTVSSLSNHNTAALSEGTNLYYTEARVQAKLDNAYEQLRAMLNNLATATTLTLNLSGERYRESS